MGEKRGLYRVVVRKIVGKRPLGRPRHRWEYNIKWDEGGMDWIDLDQDGQLAGTCDCGIEPIGSIKCVEFLN
jgi:hypothetical protein